MYYEFGREVTICIYPMVIYWQGKERGNGVVAINLDSWEDSVHGIVP